ncbi:MAG: acyl-CoA thioesterase II [Phenylobacterium sp.]|uniref:acyl-CoA thioesterase n=1 Tax=Phenylobacterium sp. TaxID=1871053 RepID=UPI002736A3E4|nr:acyl-CoA thioesterase II [Phenylobacterium sp.]MDP3173860.1 acyl-CoA thioesterase II [Phenylobacterium sp.]
MILKNTLLETFALEPLGDDAFRGISLEGGPARVYGGQVVSQALLAANTTIDGWLCHSLHCYYVRGGDPALPLDFTVERVRDGGSFATRSVTGRQNGAVIFTMMCSYQSPERGLEHQDPMPPAPAPATLPDRAKSSVGMQGALDIRFTEGAFDPPGDEPPMLQAWMRAREPIGEDPRLHQAALAYASDWAVMSAAMRLHGVTWTTPGMQGASLDHAVWFHQPTDFNQWHLFTVGSPRAGEGRGFAFGGLYREDGVLVASLAQEGLIRIRAPKPA